MAELHGELCQILALEPSEVPGGKICKSMRSSPLPHDCGPQELLTLMLASIQPSAVRKNDHLGVPADLWHCCREASLGVVSLRMRLTPLMFGWQFALQSHFPDGVKESH